MEITVKHVQGMHFQGTGSTGKIIEVDRPVDAGGDGTGAGPMELVLMAVAGCSGIDIVDILRKMRVSYSRFEMFVTGQRADDHPRVFTGVHIVYRFWGRKLPLNKLERAVSLSLSKYCSVANMVNKTAELTYAVEVAEEE